MRKPTPKQADRLRILGSGAIVLFPRRKDWMPLLRNEWVERVGEGETPKGGFLPPLVITPAGLRALADALERDGRPTTTTEGHTMSQQSAIEWISPPR